MSAATTRASSCPKQGGMRKFLLNEKSLWPASRACFETDPSTLQAEICRAILGISMNRSIKTFLVWLLMAMLPLHAVAGSRMSCGPVHPLSSQVLSELGADSEEHPADAHAHHGGEHASQADSSVVDADPASSESDNKPHSTCSACSAFCLGAFAPPSTHLAVPAFDGSDAVIVAPAAFAVGFIQDGPQRPPRHQAA